MLLPGNPANPFGGEDLESAARQDGRYVAKAVDGVDSAGQRLGGRLYDRTDG
jgi:hypothetical protein